MMDLKQYARSLRVIGQESMKFHPIFLQVELQGDMYLVTVEDSRSDRRTIVPEPWRKLPEQDAGAVQSGNSRQGILNFIFSSAASSTRLQRQFTGAELEILDKKWARRRRPFWKKKPAQKQADLWNFPKLWSLPEHLRTVGRYIEAEGEQLGKLVMENGALTIYVKDKQGNEKAQRCSLQALLQLQADMISERQTSEYSYPKDLRGVWEQVEQLTS